MSAVHTDGNLLFGVLALQNGRIDARQFVEASTAWAIQQDVPLSRILMDLGWLRAEDCRQVEFQLRRLTDKDQEVFRPSTVTTPLEIQTVLTSAGDPSILALQRGHEQQAPGPKTSDATSEFQFQDALTRKRLHSTGGIGQVWIAFDEVLQREIALKELKAEEAGSPRSRERFFREAQLTGQLEHPGVVPVYSYAADAESGCCYYTMRFIRGRTLSEAVREYHQRRRTAQTDEVSGELIRLLNAFTSVCQTVAYAHSRDVLHRDLKGANVVLGDFGEVILLDWGLAKRLTDTGPPAEISRWSELRRTGRRRELASPLETMHGEKLGTPAYMAPEQATGQIDRIDKRTDIYGLAAILYEILVGFPPFLGASIVEVLDAVIHQLPQPPSAQSADVPAEIERICLRGLSKDPEARQQSALELAEQVQSWIAERAARKQTEQERERFFNLSLDLLAIVDARGVLRQTNPAWKSVLGWDAEELSGRPIRSLLHPDEDNRLADKLGKILVGGSLTAVERRCLRKDGAYRWISWNASLIAGESAVYIVGRDVTERKQAERTFQELLESAPDGMVVISEAGRIVLVNAQLERMFGFPRVEMLGQPVEILVPEEHRAAHPAHLARFLASPGFRPMASGLKLRGRRKNGDVFPVEISLSPVRTEQGLLVSAAVRDLSGRRAEEHRT